MAILSNRLMTDVGAAFSKGYSRRISFMDVSGRMLGSQDSLRSILTKGKRNYALQESVNRGEAFILQCASGVLCWVLALEERRRVHGGVIGGPFVSGPDAADYIKKQLLNAGGRSASTMSRMVRKLPRGGSQDAVSDAGRFSELFQRASGWTSVLMRENLLKMRQMAQLAQSMEDQHRDGIDRPIYAFEKERALLANIRAGARNEARSILNDMLSNIYLATSEIAVLRARSIELMSYLTRAAVEDNPLLEPLIRMNHMWTERLTTADSFESLSGQLMSALDEFIDAVYMYGLNRGNQSVRAAMDYVREHFAAPISLREVATHIGLSPWRTAHIVKEYTGRTVVEHILDFRIRRAQQLLARTEMKCTDVCFEVGFNDQSYFTKQFRKLTGVTPGKYRKG